MQIGRLTLLCKYEDAVPQSNKFAFRCECGRTKDIILKDVLRGMTKSCGACKTITLDSIINTRFGSLTVTGAGTTLIKSHTSINSVCDCGKTSIAEWHNLKRGAVKSCGKCDLIKAGSLSGQRFGSLVVTSHVDLTPGSKRKIELICDCGKVTFKSAGEVIHGRVKTCGRCDEIVGGDVFGRLTLISDIPIARYSHKTATYRCKCGVDVVKQIISVSHGKTKSCGNCSETKVNWFNSNKAQILSLVPPFEPAQIPNGWLRALEPVIGTRVPFKALCGACGSEYSPWWMNIRRGVSLTCGCLTSRVSSVSLGIKSFLDSKHVPIEQEYKIGDYKYDFVSIDKRVVVEFNGLRWHSFPQSKSQDRKKYNNAVLHGYRPITIFEDEWVHRQSVMEIILNNLLNTSRLVSLRPSACEIRPVPSTEADAFYAKTHYIGPVKAPINYAVFYGQAMVACMSFKRPARQQVKHDYELVRMSSDGLHRVHGIWSKLFNRFITERNPSSIVTYSDNRFFNGAVYGKMGFVHDGNVPQDYYWVKGLRRVHKSSMRKSKEEKSMGMTESELRESDGWRKLFDLGKTRWVYRSPVG